MKDNHERRDTNYQRPLMLPDETPPKKALDKAPIIFISFLLILVLFFGYKFQEWLAAGIMAGVILGIGAVYIKKGSGKFT